MSEEPICWKEYFASLSREKLHEFQMLIHSEVARRRLGDLPPPTEEELMRVSRGDKIGAIKLYRSRTACGLAEAKNAIELFM